MSYYAIGIGGTGAKCLESLVHLAAAGMMPGGDLYVLFVDPDNSNGSRDRAKETLNKYRACKNNLTLGRVPLLKTEINSFNSDDESVHWTPFEKEARPSLGNFFNYENLAKNKNHPATAHLFEVLYSKTERETTLEKGFHGHPSIGSGVIAQTVDFEQRGLWSQFRAQIRNDSNAKVFLAGSIFGGTGASGFPTIAQLIKNELTSVKLGGALILPYFKFISEEVDNERIREQDDEEQTDELKTKSDYFLMNTQAALNYYSLRDETDIYDAVYLLGNGTQVTVENSSGGSEQKNAPHFIELYAALAAIHFFGDSFENAGEAQYFLTARENKNRLKWSDLPDGDNGNTIRSGIAQLTRFAFAYLHFYLPTIRGIVQGTHRSKDAAWFANFFKQKGLLGWIGHNKINLTDDQTTDSLEHTEKYCKAFLSWLANIQANSGENEIIELIRHGAFANSSHLEEEILKPASDFESERFSDLIQDDNRYGDLDTLGRLMSGEGKKEVGDAQGVGRFLSTLYQNCGR